ncbi:MAG TPA: hypothetical protein VJA21_24035 [Verrucomicrobiae bacterium]
MSRFLILIRRPAVLTGLALWVSPLSSRAGPDAELPPLTNASQLRQFSLSAAKRGCPAQLRGVSTFYHGSQGELFVQDETGGILARVHGSYGHELGVGQLLEIQGTTLPGSSPPELEATRVTLIGEGPLPPVVRVSGNQLADSQLTGTRVETSGLVHAVQTDRRDALLGLEMVNGTNEVVATIKDYHLEDCRRLVDAEVVITGILCGAPSGQPEVRVHSMGDITVTKYAPVDPFDQPSSDLNKIPGLAHANQPIHRLKVSGTVTLQQPGRAVFIRDRTRSFFVSTDQKTQLQPGDVIEVVGFPAVCKPLGPMLQHTAFRRMHGGAPPSPVSISAEEGSTIAYHAALVTLEGEVLFLENDPPAALTLQSSNVIFSARLNGPAVGFPEPIRRGNRLRLTGICLPSFEPANRSTGFELLLRSPADVTMLAGIEKQRGGWMRLILAAAFAVGTLVVVILIRLRKHRSGGP